MAHKTVLRKEPPCFLNMVDRRIISLSPDGQVLYDQGGKRLAGLSTRSVVLQAGCINGLIFIHEDKQYQCFNLNTGVHVATIASAKCLNPQVKTVGNRLIERTDRNQIRIIDFGTV